MKNKMDISVSGAVTTIRMDDPRKGWEQWFLLMSDNHHDSIYCNRDLETEHLEEAKRRNARVFIFGDFFDAMQGRFDPRRSMDELRKDVDENMNITKELQKVVILSGQAINFGRWVLGIFGVSVIALIWSLITGQATLLFK